MARTTGIEWTEHTWNPVVGCSIASAGCTNCYAMRQARRIEGFGTVPAYQGTTKSTKGGPVWTGKIARASDSQVNKPASIPGNATIFVNSMSDLFHPDAKDEWRDDAYSVMRRVDRHVYQVLTKRPEVAARYYADRPINHNLPHVWLGVSVERADAKWRIDVLRTIPAAVRFLSIEPLIGPVGKLDLTGIHWVITGGESGPKARPCKPEWVREIRDQCLVAGVPLFHKQWGKYANHPWVIEHGLPEREVAEADPNGKGGAILDDVIWREMPKPARPVFL